MDELPDDEARDLLSRSWVASLGLSREGEAHVIPVTYAFDGQVVLLQPRGRLDVNLTEEAEGACLLVTETVSDADWRYVTVHGELEAVEEDEVAGKAVESTFEMAEGSATRAEGIGVWRLAIRAIRGFEQVSPITGADDGMDIV